MKVSDITKILDKTWKVRLNGKNQIPCFIGPSGVGKSQIVAQWCEKMKSEYPDFKMIDRRLATLDSSDFMGLPWKNEEANVTEFLPPDFLPQSGKGVLFLDELNRGNTSVMNAVMQLLTERSIGNYKLPEGYIIVTAINPADSDAYDVNSMDAALANRLISYQTRFDMVSLIEYATKKEWSSTVISYLRSGQWVYKDPGQGDGIYISPRSWEFLSDDEQVGSKDYPDLHHETCVALLGKNIGLDYWNFCHKTKPITYKELLTDFNKSGKNIDKFKNTESFKNFEKYGNPQKANSYRADLLQATFQSIIDAGANVDENILISVINVMPVDQSAALFHAISFKNEHPANWLTGMKMRHPDAFARIRSVAAKNKE